MKVYDNKNDKLVTVAFNFHSGSYNETKETLGIAHLVEHLVFRGTKNRSSEEINEYIESLGGYLNAYTSYENTKFYCTVPSNYIKEAIDLLIDICFNNTIPEDEFELEKDIVINELKMYEDNPANVCQENLYKLMFNNAFNRQVVGGTPKSVSKITRQDVLKYIKQNFTKDNVEIIITGNVEIDLSYLKGFKVSIKKDNYEFDIQNTLIKASKEGIQQSQISWGIVGPKLEDKDSIALELINIYLGGNASSILYKEIRERRGFVYEIITGIDWFTNYSVLIGYASLNETNIKKTMKIIIDEYKNIKLDNLEACKNYLIGEIYRKTETTSGRNDFYTNNNITIEDKINKIKNTTINDIQRVIDKYFKQAVVFSILIPKGGNQ